MVIGRPGGRYHWQFMGEAEPHHTPGCSRPPQGVPAEVRAREVTRGLREVARKEAREAREVARGLREVARKEGGVTRFLWLVIHLVWVLGSP